MLINNKNYNKLLSVIIPIYNCEKFLKKCLESVINQTYKNLQIICVNDGSPDSSLKILNEFANLDSRIEIVNLTKNQGQGFARNQGLKIAKGEFVGFVDGDDYLDLEYYEKLIAEIVKTQSEIAFASIKFCKKNGKEKIIDKYKPKILTEINAKINSLNNGSTCTKIFSKKLIDDFAVTFPADLIFEDNIFLLKAALNAKKICFVEDCFYNYVANSSSTMQSASYDLRRLKDRRIITLMIIKICEGYSGLKRRTVYNFLYKSLYKDLKLSELAHDDDKILLFKIYLGKIRHKIFRILWSRHA